MAGWHCSRLLLLGEATTTRAFSKSRFSVVVAAGTVSTRGVRRLENDDDVGDDHSTRSNQTIFDPFDQWSMTRS